MCLVLYLHIVLYCKLGQSVNWLWCYWIAQSFTTINHCLCTPLKWMCSAVQLNQPVKKIMYVNNSKKSKKKNLPSSNCLFFPHIFSSMDSHKKQQKDKERLLRMNISLQSTSKHVNDDENIFLVNFLLIFVLTRFHHHLFKFPVTSYYPHK